MDDMQRYRDIRDNADPDDPTTTFRQTVVVACDEALVEALKLERQGKPGKVRALGFTATADLLERDGLVDALADCVTKAVEHGEQDDGFVAFYLLPTGPIHRAIALLQQHGITVRPGFDGRGKATPVKGAGRA